MVSADDELLALLDPAPQNAPVAVEQGSAAWKQLRLGRFGGSRMKDLLTKGKGDKPSETRLTYLRELALERMTGIPQGFEGNIYTEFGHQEEPKVRAMFEARTGKTVIQTAYIAHPKLKNAGVSPDGIISMLEGLEIKSHMKAAHHLDVIDNGLPKAHEYQCQWNMACHGSSFWNYVSWCPFVPDELKFVHLKVHRNPALIAEMEAEVAKADAEVEAIIVKWREYGARMSTTTQE